MNNSSSSPNHPSAPPLPVLLKAIEDYFECRLSDTDERQLTIWLGETRLTHPAIDEARAVIGIRCFTTSATGITKLPSPSVSEAESPRAPRPSRRILLANRIIPAAGIAASLAMIITIAAYLFAPGRDSGYIAYSGGVRIDDESRVMMILQSQLRDFEAQQEDDIAEFDGEIAEIAPLIEDASDISELFL